VSIDGKMQTNRPVISVLQIGAMIAMLASCSQQIYLDNIPDPDPPKPIIEAVHINLYSSSDSEVRRHGFRELSSDHPDLDFNLPTEFVIETSDEQVDAHQQIYARYLGDRLVAIYGIVDTAQNADSFLPLFPEPPRKRYYFYTFYLSENYPAFPIQGHWRQSDEKYGSFDLNFSRPSFDHQAPQFLSQSFVLSRTYESSLAIAISKGNPLFFHFEVIRQPRSGSISVVDHQRAQMLFSPVNGDQDHDSFVLRLTDSSFDPSVVIESEFPISYLKPVLQNYSKTSPLNLRPIANLTGLEAQGFIIGDQVEKLKLLLHDNDMGQYLIYRFNSDSNQWEFKSADSSWSHNAQSIPQPWQYNFKATNILEFAMPDDSQNFYIAANQTSRAGFHAILDNHTDTLIHRCSPDFECGMLNYKPINGSWSHYYDENTYTPLTHSWAGSADFGAIQNPAIVETSNAIYWVQAVRHNYNQPHYLTLARYNASSHQFELYYEDRGWVAGELRDPNGSRRLSYIPPRLNSSYMPGERVFSPSLSYHSGTNSLFLTFSDRSSDGAYRLRVAKFEMGSSTWQYLDQTEFNDRGSPLLELDAASSMGQVDSKIIGNWLYVVYFSVLSSQQRPLEVQVINLLDPSKRFHRQLEADTTAIYRLASYQNELVVGSSDRQQGPLIHRLFLSPTDQLEEVTARLDESFIEQGNIADLQFVDGNLLILVSSRNPSGSRGDFYLLYPNSLTELSTAQAIQQIDPVEPQQLESSTGTQEFTAKNRPFHYPPDGGEPVVGTYGSVEVGFLNLSDTHLVASSVPYETISILRRDHVYAENLVHEAYAYSGWDIGFPNGIDFSGNRELYFLHGGNDHSGTGRNAAITARLSWDENFQGRVRSFQGEIFEVPGAHQFSEYNQINFQWGSDVAIDRQRNRMYVSETFENRIRCFDISEGIPVELFEFGQAWLSHPQGMDFDENGNLLVVDTKHSRISRFSRSGVYLGSFGEAGLTSQKLFYPFDIAVDTKTGVRYVSNPFTDTILIYDSQDRFVSSFSKWQAGGISGPFAVSPISNFTRALSGVAADNNELFVGRGDNIIKFRMNFPLLQP